MMSKEWKRRELARKAMVKAAVDMVTASLEGEEADSGELERMARHWVAEDNAMVAQELEQRQKTAQAPQRNAYYGGRVRAVRR
jgi:hypothetical protein